MERNGKSQCGTRGEPSLPRRVHKRERHGVHPRDYVASFKGKFDSAYQALLSWLLLIMLRIIGRLLQGTSTTDQMI